ncbi:DNA phosphorothioation system sulfurtransferase DndC [Aquimarina algiphila]|uniref:DNA phosphorothioation system sulfurtransferase DndC n=1 Tax=Aquimarina algiphila TaxID=2047982 RepID=UPI00249086B1|nr:DNA phosphorothioation system sulfurtransferase DndC [Aquimarina algiphila]
MSKRIDKIVDEIVDQYTYADTSERPWIIGFSGGKDSTVLLTLVWKALEKIKEWPTPFQLRRPIHVVCNDTLVENPVITSYVDDVLGKIEIAAREQDLPIFVKKTAPALDETFWVNVLGKGYPVPNNSFRWCTDKLKIRPTSKFLHEQIDEKGEAIVLLGTRYDESATRERSIRKHEIKGQRLSKHQSSINTYTYAPIKELMLEEVWYIINTFPSPWGYDNSILFQIYADASADDYECPTVVTNKEHSSCGQSRFGCWTCTVVKKDKSMSALIDNGQQWMKPLLDFRNQLVEERNVHEYRMPERRDERPAVREDGTNWGPYWPWYRHQKLKQLLEIQKEIQKERPHISLISNQELIAIQVTWNRDLYFDKTVGDLYRDIFDKDISTNESNSLNNTEKRILKEICEGEMSYYHLIDNLIALQETKTLMVSKYGLHNDIEKRIERFVNPKEYENK